MTGNLWLRHSESHIGKQPSRLAFVDGALGLGVRLGARRPDDVQPQLAGDLLQLSGGHVEDCAP